MDFKLKQTYQLNFIN